MSQSQDEPMLTVKQVARRMNVDEATVRRWIQAGRLRAVNIGHLRPNIVFVLPILMILFQMERRIELIINILIIRLFTCQKEAR